MRTGETFPEPSLLKKGAEWLGLDLTPLQLAQFSTCAAELVVWNQKVNLTTITDIEGIQTRHFLDSLTCFLGFPDVEGTKTPRPLTGLPPLAGVSLIDIGTGAGFPGIPLAIARPEMSVLLLESVGKKTAFVEHLVRDLDLERVSVVTGRAEDVARGSGQRERYLVAVSRAVADLAVLAEYCLPFVKIGGRLIAPKRGDIRVEVDAARESIEALGGNLFDVLPVEIPELIDLRYLVLVDKVRPTPPGFPRRAGIPAKRPIARKRGQR